MMLKNAIVITFVITLILTVQTEAFIRVLTDVIRKIGKRSLKGMDTVEYIYDPSFSAADLWALEKILNE